MFYNNENFSFSSFDESENNERMRKYVEEVSKHKRKPSDKKIDKIMANNSYTYQFDAGTDDGSIPWSCTIEASTFQLKSLIPILHGLDEKEKNETKQQNKYCVISTDDLKNEEGKDVSDKTPLLADESDISDKLHMKTQLKMLKEEFFKTLSEDKIETLRLKYCDCKNVDIAKMLGVTSACISKRIKDANEKLLSLLRKYDLQQEDVGYEELLDFLFSD